MFQSNRSSVPLLSGVGSWAGVKAAAVNDADAAKAMGDITGLNAEVRLQQHMTAALTNPAELSKKITEEMKALTTELGKTYKKAIDDLTGKDLTNAEAHAIAMQKVETEKAIKQMEIQTRYGTPALSAINPQLEKLSNLPMGGLKATLAAAPGPAVAQVQ